MAAEIRFALLRALVEEGASADVGRFHAACADVHENLELFGQVGFMAYAQEEIWYRPPELHEGPRSWMRGLWPGGDVRPGRATMRPPRALTPRPARRMPGTSSTCGPTPRRRRSPALEGYSAGLGVGRPRGDRPAQQP